MNKREEKDVNNRNFAVIFDMDGVIVDSNPVHKIALKKFLAKHGIKLTDNEFKEKVYGRSNKDWLPEVFGDKLTSADFKKFANEKEALFRKLYAPAIQPVKGLIRFLSKLEELDIPCAVATSAPPENVKFILEKTNTALFFDVIIDESQINKGKPDPEIYLKTVQKLGFNSEKCVVIEDSLAGVESAKKAGCPVIGLTTTHSEEEFFDADLVINDFDDLKVEQLFDLIQA